MPAIEENSFPDRDSGGVLPVTATSRPGRLVIGEATVDFESEALDASKHKQDPFRPDTLLDGWSNESFTVRAACSRGDGHRYRGEPRQDEFALAHHADSGAVLVAIADGVSSAAESHLGAMIVCRYAIRFMLRALSEGHAVDWAALVRESAWGLVDLAHKQIEDTVDAQKASEMYATTLTAMLLRPQSPEITYISAASVGDTALWMLSHGHLQHLLGGKPLTNPDAIFSSEVVALPQVPDELSVIEREIDADSVVIAMSDGIGDPLGDGSGQVGSILASELISPPSLLNFARIADFSRSTFIDDRALIAVWRKLKTSSRES